jgi:hypothetical protein
MTTGTTETSPRVFARVAGFLYLIIIVGGVFSLLYVPSTLIVPVDAAATASSITASESLLRLGVLSSLVVLLCDAGVAVLFYVLFLPVSRTISLLSYVLALSLLSGADYLSAFETSQLQAFALLFLDAFDEGYLIAQVFFAFSVLFLGYLVYRSSYFPSAVGTVLGVLLILSCFAYLAESVTAFLFTGYEELVSSVVVIPAIAEISLALWLLVKGVTVRQRTSREID